MFRIATFKPKILGLEFGRPICCRHADNNRVPEFNKFQVKNRDCFFFVSFSVNRVRLDEQLELKNIWCCVCVFVPLGLLYTRSDNEPGSLPRDERENLPLGPTGLCCKPQCVRVIKGAVQLMDRASRSKEPLAFIVQHYYYYSSFSLSSSLRFLESR
jgi:hypothetical protein